MADPETAENGEPLTNGADTAPVAGMLSQYIRDLSFENPNAPAIYQTQAAIGLNVQFNIGSGQVGEDLYEVQLKIEVRAQSDTTVAYLIDLTYAGLFALRNVPQDQIQPFLLAEGPRLLFPFARRIIADAVSESGFPPLMLEPIDFTGLYLQQLEEHQAQQGAAGEADQA